MCKHFWLIDSSNHGRCKLCGAMRYFQHDIGRVKKYGDTLSPFEKRIINGFTPQHDYYWHGHIDNSHEIR